MPGPDWTLVALEAARKAYEAGDFNLAVEWLERVPHKNRPSDLVSQVGYSAFKQALQEGAWGQAATHLEAANAVRTSSLFQRRLGLLRGRADFNLDPDYLSHVLDRTLRSERLGLTTLQPAVDEVWALGAYISRGAQSGTPISRFIRLGKEPLPVEEQQAMSLVGGIILCHFILHETTVLREADLVVSIPANPGRYADRGWSLPDELAKSIERHLAVPFEFDLLRSTAADIQLRGMSWTERRKAVRGSMTVAENPPLKDRTVLVVDDVVTSGATLKEAGRQLREAGASGVVGVALCHTEG